MCAKEMDPGSSPGVTNSFASPEMANSFFGPGVTKLKNNHKIQLRVGRDCTA